MACLLHSPHWVDLGGVASFSRHSTKTKLRMPQLKQGMICNKYRLSHLIELVLVACLDKELYHFSRHSTKTKLVECTEESKYRSTHLIKLVLVECLEKDFSSSFPDTPPRPSWLSVRKRCHKSSRTRFAATSVPLTSLSWSWSSVWKMIFFLQTQ